MFTETTARFLVDFGVSATWSNAPWIIDRAGASLDSSKYGPGGLKQQSALVLFDKPDSDILGKRVQTRGYKIRFPATQFLGIKFADAVSIAGANYSVLEINSLADGVFFEAELQLVVIP